eukprot:1575879-Lingulodinium_polyedra.AAC.1
MPRVLRPRPQRQGLQGKIGSPPAVVDLGDVSIVPANEPRGPASTPGRAAPQRAPRPETFVYLHHFAGREKFGLGEA